MITREEGKIIAGQVLVNNFGREFVIENIDKIGTMEKVENGVLRVFFLLYSESINISMEVAKDGGIYVEEKNFPDDLMDVKVDLKTGKTIEVNIK